MSQSSIFPGLSRGRGTCPTGSSGEDWSRGHHEHLVSLNEVEDNTTQPNSITPNAPLVLQSKELSADGASERKPSSLIGKQRTGRRLGKIIPCHTDFKKKSNPSWD
ncbi:hypothetical protein GDO78_017081 [Eleutherodactylus coqui]|uniref:Uncharacterized protein n=1 Tax=Eleutherodactylus coqui TaxID=57060 RepID=A0A8J6BE47_ELECQ|nr:hypothetical protein GDO78_017081 [Eleutherodactylus coqui]